MHIPIRASALAALLAGVGLSACQPSNETKLMSPRQPNLDTVAGRMKATLNSIGETPGDSGPPPEFATLVACVKERSKLCCPTDYTWDRGNFKCRYNPWKETGNGARMGPPEQPDDQPDNDSEGWKDLGNGVRIREVKRP